MVGLTEAEPLEYTYVDAPVGIIVKEDPLQMNPELTAMVGTVLTVTDDTAVLVQPAAVVPVTV